VSVDRFVVLGLGSVRSMWTRDVTGWAMSGALAIDFIKCVSVDEVKARLRGGRSHSALLCDGAVPGVDRDLFALANELETAVVVVGEAERNWVELGAHAILHEVFGREDLLETLETYAKPIRRGEHLDLTPDDPEPLANFTAQLVAVTGRPGSGVSTCAMALAQGAGASGTLGGLVVLADLALHADQAMLHDATDIVPGLQELVDAHRTGRPSVSQIRAMTYSVPHRRYDLLLGLRRHRDWVTVRPRSFEAAIDGLRRSYRMVVADLANDFEGEDECGSIDVEERNTASRATALVADVVLAVGTPTLVGVHGLVRTIDSLVELGVATQNIQPVFNRAPRQQRARSDLARSLSELVNADDRLTLPTPVHLPQRRHLDDVHRNGTPIPTSLSEPLLGAVRAGLKRNSPAPRNARLSAQQPEPVTPGSLGVMGSDGDAT